MKGENVEELNIKVKFPKERQMKSFVKMLAWMEFCGNIGHCTDFMVRLDGDGSARPKIEFETEELQESYDELRKSMNDLYKTTPQYPDDVDIHICID